MNQIGYVKLVVMYRIILRNQIQNRSINDRQRLFTPFITVRNVFPLDAVDDDVAVSAEYYDEIGERVKK